MNIDNPQQFITDYVRFEPLFVTGPTEVKDAFKRIMERLDLHV